MFPKEFIELNVNTNMMIKNAKLALLNISIATVFLMPRLHCDKNYQHKSDKKINERLFKTHKFSKPW